MTTEFPHQRRVLAVRLPTVGEVLSLWMEQHLRTEEITDILRDAEVRRLVTTPDGREVDAVEARAIVTSEPSFSAYRIARDGELAAATEGGAIRAECPHCQAWTADLTPLAVAVALRTRMAPLTDDVGDLAVPALAANAGRALDLAPLTTRITTVLPGALPREVTLSTAGTGRRLREWTARSAGFFAGSQATEDWTPDSPGWRALLRLASLAPAMTEDLASGRDPVRGLVRLDLADFLFLDNVYYLTHLARVPPQHGALLRCPHCGGDYLPLARSPEWCLD